MVIVIVRSIPVVFAGKHIVTNPLVVNGFGLIVTPAKLLVKSANEFLSILIK
jgi:hypothetical protein